MPPAWLIFVSYFKMYLVYVRACQGLRTAFYSWLSLSLHFVEEGAPVSATLHAATYPAPEFPGDSLVLEMGVTPSSF